MSSYTFTLNMIPNTGTPVVVNLSQGDIGRELTFKLVEGSDPNITIATDASAITIEGLKPSGLGFTETCTATSGNTITVNTTEAMTQESGMIPAEVRFVAGTTDLGTANIIFAIEESPHPSGTTDGTTEEARTVLEQAQAAANAAAESAEDAAEAVEKVGTIVQEYVDESLPNVVDDWLTDHPEATTTVQDGSLTESKFSDALKLKTIKDYVTPEMFGAKGDGVTNDTDAMTECFKHPVIVLTNGKTYKVDYIRIGNEYTYLFGNGATISINSVKSGTVTVDNFDTACQFSNKKRWTQSLPAETFFMENVDFEGNGSTFVGFSNFASNWSLYNIILLYDYENVIIHNCSFHDSIQDAICVWAKHVEITDCRFEDIATSAATFSIGENGTRNAISINSCNVVYENSEANKSSQESTARIAGNSFHNIFNEIIRLDSYANTVISDNNVIEGKQYFMESFWNYAAYPCLVSIENNYIDKMGDSAINVSTVTPYGLTINIMNNELHNLHYDFDGAQPEIVYGSPFIDCGHNGVNPVNINVIGNFIESLNVPTIDDKCFLNCLHNNLMLKDNVIKIKKAKSALYFGNGIIKDNIIEAEAITDYQSIVCNRGNRLVIENNVITHNRISRLIGLDYTDGAYENILIRGNILDSMIKYAPLLNTNAQTQIKTLIVTENDIKNGTFVANKGTVNNYILKNNVTPTSFLMHTDVIVTNSVVSDNIATYNQS